MKPMLAQDWDFTADPTGWLVSEKLDGVRAIWDGSKFLSRNGREFPAPAWVIAAMPSGVILDGELWLGRGRFQETVSAVRRGDWSALRFMIFDAIRPGALLDRIAFLGCLSLPAFCEILPQQICTSEAHLDALENEILEAGGEGLILRNPASSYEHRRSREMRKLKRFCASEATVTGHDGSTILAEMAGISFRVAGRGQLPAIGAEITVSFFGLTDSGMFRHPSLVGVRDYE